MSGAFLVDGEGHRWPVTGWWCFVCRMPLVPSNYSDVHPLCAGGLGVGWPQRQDDVA